MARSSCSLLTGPPSRRGRSRPQRRGPARAARAAAKRSPGEANSRWWLARSTRSQADGPERPPVHRTAHVAPTRATAAAASSGPMWPAARLGPHPPTGARARSTGSTSAMSARSSESPGNQNDRPARRHPEAERRRLAPGTAAAAARRGWRRSTSTDTRQLEPSPGATGSTRARGEPAAAGPRRRGAPPAVMPGPKRRSDGTWRWSECRWRDQHDVGLEGAARPGTPRSGAGGRVGPRAADRGDPDAAQLDGGRRVAPPGERELTALPVDRRVRGRGAGRAPRGGRPSPACTSGPSSTPSAICQPAGWTRNASALPATEAAVGPDQLLEGDHLAERGVEAPEDDQVADVVARGEGEQVGRRAQPVDRQRVRTLPGRRPGARSASRASTRQPAGAVDDDAAVRPAGHHGADAAYDASPRTSPGCRSSSSSRLSRRPGTSVRYTWARLPDAATSRAPSVVGPVAAGAASGRGARWPSPPTGRRGSPPGPGPRRRRAAGWRGSSSRRDAPRPATAGPLPPAGRSGRAAPGHLGSGREPADDVVEGAPGELQEGRALRLAVVGDDGDLVGAPHLAARPARRSAAPGRGPPGSAATPGGSGPA